jgi:ABC-type phosphate transport system substrate-binding protein
LNTTRTPSRARQLLVVPVLLAALTGLAACGADDSADTSAADTTSSDTSSSEAPDDSTAGGTLALVADGSMAGKCAVPSAEMLSGFDTAFEGTVVGVENGTATLQVDQWYAGQEATTVTVEAPSKDMQDLLMAVDFQQGKTYLVSATGDRVTLCGFTAEKSPELESLYSAAFTQ